MNKKHLGIILAIICFSTITVFNFNKQKENSQEIFANLEKIDLQESYLYDSPPIIIQNQAQLESFPNKTGSGTVSDPYVIENYTIESAYFVEASFHGIWIEDITSILEIRNCVIENASLNGSSSYFSSNLFLNRAYNVTVINCTFTNSSDCYQNILIKDSEDCEIRDSYVDNLNITYNIGINITNSRNITINNTEILNSQSLISTQDSNESNFIYNEFHNSSGYGFVSYDNTTDSSIYNNTFYDVYNGITLTPSDDNISITYNQILNTTWGDGIKVSGSASNYTISNNRISDIDIEDPLYPLGGNTGINIIGGSEDGMIDSNLIENSHFGITLDVDVENNTIYNNTIYNCYSGIRLQSYPVYVNITRNFINYSHYGISESGHSRYVNITWNYFKGNAYHFRVVGETDILYPDDYNFSHNAYEDYFVDHPYDVPNDVTLVDTTLNYLVSFSTLVNDSYPQYYDEFYKQDRFFFIAYYSNLDLFGFPFSEVQTFIQNERIAIAQAIIEDLIIRITVKDFSGYILFDELHHYNTSKYKNIGLDIVETSWYNDGIEDSYLFITHNSTTIQWIVSPGQTLKLRLAIDSYDYIVEDSDGEEQIKASDVDVETPGQTFNIGFTFLEIEEIEPVLNVLDYAIVIIGFGIVGILIGVGFYQRRERSPRSRARFFD